MIRTFVIPLALAVMLPVAVATAADRMLRLTHEWQVSLDVAGKVTALRDRGQAELSAAVRAPLEQAIRGWTFEPGRIGGRPAPTETTLTLDVSFVPASGDRYAIRIDDARTGGVVDAAAAAKAPPRVPREAMRPGLVARVVVKADYDADGRIFAVTAQPEQDLDASKALDAATIKTVRKWAIDPERVDGHGVASSVMLPVCYTVSIGRPPDFDCTWTPPGSRSKVGDGSAYASAPATKLASDVIGRTL